MLCLSKAAELFHSLAACEVFSITMCGELCSLVSDQNMTICPKGFLRAEHLWKHILTWQRPASNGAAQEFETFVQLAPSLLSHYHDDSLGAFQFFLPITHTTAICLFLEILFFLTYFPLRFSGVNLNFNMELLLRSKLLIIIPNPGKFSVALERGTMLGTLCLTVLERSIKLYTQKREKPQENTLCHLLRVSSLDIRHIE